MQGWAALLPSLSDDVFPHDSDSNSEGDHDMGMEEIDLDSVRWRFRDETSTQFHFTYAPPRIPFIGRRGPVKHYHSMPTFLQLFDLFWTYQTLRSIVRKTNRYAAEDDNGKPRGGEDWELLSIHGLKAFLGIYVYMGMKKQPNLKSYCQKKGSIFHCPIIYESFTRERFMTIRKCLHITNPAAYANVERGEPGFDKIRQIRWLVDTIRAACKAVWPLGKYLAIDEIMIRYKGSYSPIRQYMPNKPQKWGLKVWCIADAISKYVYDFAIYCGKSVEAVLQPSVRGEPKLAHKVVLNLVDGLDGKGHVVVMDNYFSSIGLFIEMAARGIYATGTMRSNRIGIPEDFKDTKSFNRRATQGQLEWRMHESRGIGSVLWKDKRPVLLISTHA
jgi:hypothetical protein